MIISHRSWNLFLCINFLKNHRNRVLLLQFISDFVKLRHSAIPNWLNQESQNHMMEVHK